MVVDGDVRRGLFQNGSTRCKHEDAGLPRIPSLGHAPYLPAASFRTHHDNDNRSGLGRCTASTPPPPTGTAHSVTLDPNHNASASGRGAVRKGRAPTEEGLNRIGVRRNADHTVRAHCPLYTAPPRLRQARHRLRRQRHQRGTPSPHTLTQRCGPPSFGRGFHYTNHDHRRHQNPPWRRRCPQRSGARPAHCSTPPTPHWHPLSPRKQNRSGKAGRYTQKRMATAHATPGERRPACRDSPWRGGSTAWVHRCTSSEPRPAAADNDSDAQRDSLHNMARQDFRPRRSAFHRLHPLPYDDRCSLPTGRMFTLPRHPFRSRLLVAELRHARRRMEFDTATAPRTAEAHWLGVAAARGHGLEREGEREAARLDARLDDARPARGFRRYPSPRTQSATSKRTTRSILCHRRQAPRRAQLSAATTHDERTAAKHTLWQQRHVIQKEKKRPPLGGCAGQPATRRLGEKGPGQENCR